MGEASSPVPCGSCTLCCRHQKVFLFPGDDAAALLAVRGYNSATGKEGWRLQQKRNGDCLFLGERGCTIYERRPSVCRLYDCRDHYYLPAAERRRREAESGPHDKIINARGRALVEGKG
jgi:Fe-S-cluster containining protein